MLFQFIITNHRKVSEILDTHLILLSGSDECYEVTADTVIESNLKSNQEEADTKVVLHSMAILESTDLDIVLKSPSGDTDILILLLGHIKQERSRIFYDCGSGANRKGVWLNKIQMSLNKIPS